MTIPFQAEGQLLPVSSWLKSQLAEMVVQHSINVEPFTALTFHFHDPNYSATQGGIHPVEIRLVLGLNGWLFDTITDFSYQGYGDWAELDKELDFDFLSPEYTHIYLGVLEHSDAIELYQVWENNFQSHCQMHNFCVSIDTH
jgi:hypothetical protein